MDISEDPSDQSEAETLRWRLEAAAKQLNSNPRVRDECLADARRLLEIGDTFQKGMAHLILGDYEKAQELFESSVGDFSCKYWEGPFWRANAAYLARDYDRAAALYQRYVAEVDPENDQVARMAAECLMHTDSGSVVQNYTRAQKILLGTVSALEEGSSKYAEHFVSLGNAYRMFRACPDGSAPADLVQAEDAFREAMSIYASVESWSEWAEVAIHLAPVVILQGDPDETGPLERGRQLLETAVSKLDPQDQPFDWALAHLNLGATIRRMEALNVGPGRREAIRCFEEAIAGYERSQDAVSADLIVAHQNIARAVRECPFHWAGAGRVRTLVHYRKAAEAANSTGDLVGYADARMTAGNMLLEKPWGYLRKNRQDAYECYSDASEVYGKEYRKDRWALCHARMAVLAYKTPLVGCRIRAERRKKALMHCELAGRVYTAEDYPDQHASMQRIVKAVR